MCVCLANGYLRLILLPHKTERECERERETYKQRQRGHYKPITGVVCMEINQSNQFPYNYSITLHHNIETPKAQVHSHNQDRIIRSQCRIEPTSPFATSDAPNLTSQL